MASKKPKYQTLIDNFGLEQQKNGGWLDEFQDGGKKKKTSANYIPPKVVPERAVSDNTRVALPVVPKTKAKPSPVSLNQRVAKQNEIIKKANREKENYAIVDKNADSVFYFKPTGENITGEPIITGASQNDTDYGLSMKEWFEKTGSTSHEDYFKYLKENKFQTTPSGIFRIGSLRNNTATNPDFYGGLFNSIFRPEREKQIYESRIRDYGPKQKLLTLISENGVPSSKAIHGTGNPDRIAAFNTLGANRAMSNGCINVNGKTVCFDQIGKGSGVFILPEESQEVLNYNDNVTARNKNKLYAQTRKDVANAFVERGLPITKGAVDFVSSVAEKESKNMRSLGARAEAAFPYFSGGVGAFQIHPNLFKQYLPKDYEVGDYNTGAEAVYNFYNQNQGKSAEEMYKRYSGDRRGEYSPVFNRTYDRMRKTYEDGGYMGEAGYTDQGFDYNSSWGGQFAMGGSIPGTTGFTYARTNSPAPSEGPYAKKTMPSAQNGLTFLEPTSPKLPSSYVIPYNTPSSELATSVGGEDGDPAFLIPTFKYGHPLDDPYAEFRKTGEHLGGPFKTWQEADTWDREVRHPYVERGQDIPTPLRRWGKDFENGGSMSYYQHGLDWKPKTISRDGDEIPKNQNAQYVLPRYDMPRLGSDNTRVNRADADVLQTARINQKIQNQGQIKKAAPARSKASKALAIATHPMTALSYKVKGQDIPENFERGELNPYEAAVNIVNPFGMVDAAASIPGNVARGEFLQAGLNAASVFPALGELRGLKAPIARSMESGLLSKMRNVKGKIQSPTAGTDYIWKSVNNNIKGDLPEGLTKQHIADILESNLSWIESPEYLSRRMATTGETAKQVTKDVIALKKRFKNTKIQFTNKDLDKNVGGTYAATPFNAVSKIQKDVIKIRPDQSLEEVMAAIDHEVKHALSPAFKNEKLYKNYPSLSTIQGDDLRDASSKQGFFNKLLKGDRSKDYVYLEDPAEQQVRFNRLNEKIREDLNLTRNEGKLTDEQFDQWTDAQLKDGFSSFEKSGYGDVGDLLASRSSNIDRRKILEALNKAWVVLPVVGAASAVQQKKQGGVMKAQEGEILGPTGFLNSYFQGPTFKSRFKGSKKDYEHAMDIFNYHSKTNKPYVIKEDPTERGSHATNYMLNVEAGYPKDASVILSEPQAKALKTDLWNDIYPHEYSHKIRALSPEDEQLFAYVNKNPKGKMMYDQWQQSGDPGSFSQWLNNISHGNLHDEQPNESYSDLNSLRYLMYKQGIYDTRKGPMKVEHIKKAMKDPYIKKQMSPNRLLHRFTPEKLAKLNNEVAKNDEEMQLDVAENGTKKYKVGKSKIEGKGALANKNIKAGDTIGVAHEILNPYTDYDFTDLGKSHNHSDNPTAHNVLIGNKRYLVANKNLRPGEEITTDYRMQPDLEQPENFKKGGWLDNL